MHNTMSLRHQNLALAVRRELGWPAFRPANDCICFCGGRTMDLAVGSHLAQISQQTRKDAIYLGWSSTTALLPTAFAVVFREMLSVDVVDNVIPYAANENAAVVFINTRGDETFAVDARGSLVRVPGRPKMIRKGHQLAMKRIKATAAGMRDDILEGNQFVPTGADWIEPDVPIDFVVRFT